MNLRNFNFTPLPPVEATAESAPPSFPDPLGPLAQLPGRWVGQGFNMIWRPFFELGGTQNHFLELNLTDETIDFAPIGGNIPNRGLLQPDLFMTGLTYLQAVNDHNLSTPQAPAGLHAEPGVWLNVPATSDPQEPPTVVRMGSIPHGTAIVAQGTSTQFDHAPPIGPVPPPYPAPFDIATGQPVPQPESNLDFATPYRSSGPQMNGIVQAMIDDPVAYFLTGPLAQQTVLHNVTLAVFTNNASDPDTPVSAGGGTANTAFLVGTGDGPNANASEVQSTFWIEQIQGENGAADFLQLQYRQLVFLDFAGLRWPHVSVATLVKQPDAATPGLSGLGAAAGALDPAPPRA